jgi:hypothetical protein
LIDDLAAPGHGVILAMGKGGVGKTTTVGKVAKKMADEGASVVLAAGDTFRAAAADQLSQASAASQGLLERLLCLTAASAKDGRPATFSLLIHFSGYGYEQRGLCFWLLRELEQVKARLGDRLRVVTMFHELFASGPLWGSALWLSPLQARIARKLARMSDAIGTNTELHGRWLREQVGPSTPITVQPVFSTVGEPEHRAPTSGREPSMVVFGSPSTRRRALAALPPYAEALTRQGITEILEVGSGEATPWTALGLKLRFLGRMETPDLRALLEHSAYGLIEYPPNCLGKSTVFAAYAAHGCVSINVADAGQDSDGLQSGQHFVSLSRDALLPTGPRPLEVLATAACNWYAPHSLTRQAKAFAVSCGVHPDAKA